MSNFDKIIIGVFIILIIILLWNKKEHLDATYSYLDVSGFYNNVKFNKNVDISGNMMLGQELIVRSGQVVSPGTGSNGYGPTIRLNNTDKTTTGTARSWRIINNKGDTANNIAGGLQFTTYDQGADTSYKNVAFNDKGSVDIFRGNLNLYDGNVNVWNKTNGEKIWSTDSTFNGLKSSEAVTNIAKVYADSTGTAAFNNITVGGTATFTNTQFPNNANFSQNITVGGTINATSNIDTSGNINANGNIKGGNVDISRGDPSGIGGSLSITNTKKNQGNTQKTWTLYNMGKIGAAGEYPNALEIWGYDANTNIGNRFLTINDDGNINVPNGGITANSTITAPRIKTGAIVSPQGKCYLAVQDDGNLVVYSSSTGKVVSATNKFL